MRMAQRADIGRLSMPAESTFATATHVAVAGSGYLSSAAAFGMSRYHAGTTASVPKRMPIACAMNCLRGFAPRRYPLLRSVSRSADDDALLAPAPAAMRLCWMLPGEIAANSSCITLPMAPIGVVSVSPVARHATIDSTNDMITAMRPAHHEILNATASTMTIAMVIGMRPAMNHEFGTSIAAMLASMSSFATFVAGPRRSIVNARPTLFHCRPSEARLANTMMLVPPHSAQLRGWNIVPPPALGIEAM